MKNDKLNATLHSIITKVPFTFCKPCNCYVLDNKDWEKGCDLIYGHNLTKDKIPDYSDNMNEAIKVLAWMKYYHTSAQDDPNEINPTLEIWDKEGNECGIFAGEDNKSFKNGWIVEPDHSAAYAICLAAYRLETGKDWK